MATSLERSIFRVLDTSGGNGDAVETVGTGFLVGENLAVTCAHVIKMAKAGPGSLVRVRFECEASGASVQMQVMEDGWSAPEQKVIVHQTRAGAQLKRSWLFWVLTVIFLFLVTLLLLLYLALHSCIAPFWKSLPSLPNGETAREFTDVLVRNRVNVLTDEDHYYNCRIEAEETCWIPIPREVNNPKSDMKGIGIMITPLDARQVVVDQHYGPEGTTDVLIAIIRRNGQVSICTANYGRLNSVFLFIIYGACWGALSVVGLGLYGLIRSIKEKVQASQED